MSGSPAAWPVFSWRGLVPLLLFCLLPLSGQAQEAGGAPGETADPPPAARQDVDEDEEAFRRRMELEEGDAGDLTDPLDTPDIVEVDPDAGPVDRLPPESREHLEEQLTDLIIENGRWSPSDETRPAPFEPSEAAQSDPELAAAEAEAWEEMVTAYHERERAAWERAGGRSGTGSAGAQGEGQGEGQGDGQGNGAGAGQAGGAGAGQGDARGAGPGTAGSPSGTAGEAGERAPDGEPFSALEFLGGAPPPDGAPDQQSDQAPDRESDRESEGETDQEPDQVQERAPDRESDPEPDQVQGRAPDQETSPPPAPEAGEAAATPVTEAAPPSGDPVPAADDAAPPTEGAARSSEEEPPPGSLPVEAMEALFGAEASETAPPPASREAEAPAAQDPAADAPPRAPSFWDWLLGLFGGGESPEDPTQDGPSG